MTTPTDEPALIAAAVAGGGDALDALIARYQDRVYRFGRRLCGDPEAARDVTQETLATMAGQLASFRGDASLSSWLFAIARSHCHKQRRRRAGAPPPGGTVDLDDALDLVDPGRDPAATAAGRELSRALEKALAGLEDNQREVVLLRDVEGLSAAEVAATLGLSVMAVKSRLHRGRVALRDALAAVLEPPAPAADGCPDIAELWSRRAEGEVAALDCAAMERHLEACPRCRGTCAALRQTLALCQATPAPVPPDVQAAVRAAVRALASR